MLEQNKTNKNPHIKTYVKSVNVSIISLEKGFAPNQVHVFNIHTKIEYDQIKSWQEIQLLTLTLKYFRDH